MTQLNNDHNVPTTFIGILANLFGATIIAVVAAYLLSVQGTQFFKGYVASINIKNMLGFSVILFLSVLCQMLIWSVPALVVGALTRKLIRSIGVWFDFSLRMVFVLLISLFTDVIMEKIIIGNNFAKGDGFKRILLRAFGRLYDLLTIKIVENIKLTNVLLSSQLLLLCTYILFVILVVLFIKRIFLKNKIVSFFYSCLLLMCATIVVSFLFSSIEGLLDEEWKKPIYYNSFWIIDTRITIVAILRTVCFWVALLIVAILLQSISIDKDETVVEMASPAFAKFS